MNKRINHAVESKTVGYSVVVQSYVRRALPACRWLMAIFAALNLCACTSLTPERVAALADLARVATAVGASSWLAKHPEHRQSFEDVMRAMQALLRAGITNPLAYSERLQSLPVSQLEGPSGDLLVSSDRLMLYDGGLGKAVIVHGAAEMPVIRGIGSGLRLATTKMPPSPAAMRKKL